MSLRGAVPRNTRRYITMAKKNVKQAPLPEGFVELSSTLAGFFTMKPGNTAHGCYRGAFDVRGKFGTKKVHRIEITDGETDVTDKEGDAVATQGDLVGIDEKGYLKRLASLKDGTEVFLRCLSKGPDQKDPWIFQVGVKA